MPLEPQTPSEAKLQQALEHAVLAASVAYCVSWTDPDVAALGTTALRAATKASRDKHVRDWVAQRNGVHGAAVPSAAVVNRWDAQSDAFPPVRCLRTKEPVPLQAKRDKAAQGGSVF